MNQNSASQAPRRPWTTPLVQELPRLTELTLQTGIPGAPSQDSGSTVF